MDLIEGANLSGRYCRQLLDVEPSTFQSIQSYLNFFFRANEHLLKIITTKRQNNKMKKKNRETGKLIIIHISFKNCFALNVHFRKEKKLTAAKELFLRLFVELSI